MINQPSSVKDTHTGQSESDFPMGLSQWKAHGKKYGYWKYFIQQVRESERRKYDKVKIRFEILLGRMRACEEDHPDTHRVSLREIPAWIEDFDALTEEG